jgi:hypothetical protein
MTIMKICVLLRSANYSKNASMKKLWLLLLLSCSLGAQAQNQASDSAVVQAFVSFLSEKTAAAAMARQAAAQAAMAEQLAKTTATDSPGRQAALTASKKLDSLEAEAKFRELQAAIARAGLTRIMGMQETAYPTRGGQGLAWTLIGLIGLLALIVVSGLGWAVKRQFFSLKDALSENIQDKITVTNPEYSAEKIKAWLSEFSKTALADLKAKLDAAEAALATATQANPPANAMKADDAKKQRDEALANYQAASAGPGAAALAGIARLFPPTIEVSSAGLNYDCVSRFIAARDARMQIAGNPQNVQTLQSAQAAEDQAFAAMRVPAAPIYRASASRLIAFISAMLLFIVGLACACFFLYFYLVNGVPPDLSRLPAILIALGIGMAPYAINKVSSAASSKDTAI